MSEEILKLTDYGLVGAMIAGIFAMWYRTQSALKELVHRCTEDSREERSEWRKSIESGQDRVAASLERLSDELRDLSRRRD